MCGICDHGHPANREQGGDTPGPLVPGVCPTVKPDPPMNDRNARLLEECLLQETAPWTAPESPTPNPTRLWVDGTTRWLQRQPWDAFATLTYGKYDPSVRAARRHVERFMDVAPIKMAWWVTERGERFGRIHNHALILWGSTMFGPEDAAAYWNGWWRERNGIAELQPYDPERGAAGYLASYVTKKVCEYDIWLPRAN